MASDNVGERRQDTDNQEVPAEVPGKREGQDRASGSGDARSPVDSMHVDAPKKQDTARGHAEDRARH